MLLLIALGALMGLTWPYWLGLVVVAGLLVWEHRLVKPDDLSRIDLAFFQHQQLHQYHLVCLDPGSFVPRIVLWRYVSCED